MADPTPCEPCGGMAEPVRWTLWQQPQQCGAQVPAPLAALAARPGENPHRSRT